MRGIGKNDGVNRGKEKKKRGGKGGDLDEK